MTSFDLLAPPAGHRPAFPRARTRIMAAAVACAVAAGHAVAFARSSSAAMPGLLGAIFLSLAVGEITGHIFGHGLTPWVTMLVVAVFLLRVDGRISLSRTPRADGKRGG